MFDTFRPKYTPTLFKSRVLQNVLVFLYLHLKTYFSATSTCQEKSKRWDPRKIRTQTAKTTHKSSCVGTLLFALACPSPHSNQLPSSTRQKQPQFLHKRSFPNRLPSDQAAASSRPAPNPTFATAPPALPALPTRESGRGERSSTHPRQRTPSVSNMALSGTLAITGALSLELSSGELIARHRRERVVSGWMGITDRRGMGTLFLF